MRAPKLYSLFAAALFFQALPAAAEPPTTDTQLSGIVKGERVEYPSKYFESPITVLPGVFYPVEAEKYVLPMFEEYADLFKGASVLEIGTGSGIISLYAAKLGARKVVSTDINPIAIECATLNAKRLGFSSVMEARLVPTDDMSAFSVIREDEAFDLIVSNPPYQLDLDATSNTAVVDTGVLGMSLMRISAHREHPFRFIVNTDFARS